MISIKQLAEKYESELNALLADDDLWTFKIYAQTGRIKPPQRDGDTVNGYVPGELRATSSALEANKLIMGINYLNLDFLIPEEPLHTSTAQTFDDLKTEDDDGQNVFVNYVTEIITGYFQKAVSETMTDENGDSFGIGQKAGIATTGTVEVFPGIGRAVPVSVAIDINFVAGGTNALDIELYIDGEQIPYQSLVPSRTTQLETNVHSNSTTQKHLASSDVFGIDITMPSTSETVVSELIKEFMRDYYPGLYGTRHKDINKAHFVEIKWGDIIDECYLMTVTSMNGSAQGSNFAGLQLSMGEITGDLSAVLFPDTYTVIALEYSDTTATEINVGITVSKTYAADEEIPSTEGILSYGLGRAHKISIGSSSSTTNSDGTVTNTYYFIFSRANDEYGTDITDGDFVDVASDIEDDTPQYYVYIAVMGKITNISYDGSYTILQEAD